MALFSRGKAGRSISSLHSSGVNRVMNRFGSIGRVAGQGQDVPRLRVEGDDDPLPAFEGLFGDPLEVGIEGQGDALSPGSGSRSPACRAPGRGCRRPRRRTRPRPSACRRIPARCRSCRPSPPPAASGPGGPGSPRASAPGDSRGRGPRARRRDRSAAARIRRRARGTRAGGSRSARRRRGSSPSVMTMGSKSGRVLVLVDAPAKRRLVDPQQAADPRQDAASSLTFSRTSETLNEAVLSARMTLFRSRMRPRGAASTRSRSRLASARAVYFLWSRIWTFQ